MNGQCSREPEVAVLMAVFRDPRFLQQQLASILAQDHGHITLWVSRDCTDGHIGRILGDYTTRFRPNRFNILSGPRRGSAANFLSMVLNPNIKADYYAYSDQDDIWDVGKISRAVSMLRRIPESVPALYGSRSRLIDVHGQYMGLSPFHGNRSPGFRNALVQNIMNGNTMVMNRTARNLLCAAGDADVPYHDWWTYLLISGGGGKVLYDPQPMIGYRLHDLNETGTAIHWNDRFSRWWERYRNKKVKHDIQRNIQSIHKARDLLSPDNKLALDYFHSSLNGTFTGRWYALKRSGIYVQKWNQIFRIILSTL